MESSENDKILNNYIDYCLKIINKTLAKKQNNIEAITFKKSLEPVYDKKFIIFWGYVCLPNIYTVCNGFVPPPCSEQKIYLFFI